MDKKIFVTRPFLPPRAEFDSYINQIWQADWLTNRGPLFKKFESELKAYLNVPNITLTVNGHSALEIALKGLEIQGEVITSPFTFASTTHALTLNNITPVFCDIKENDLTIDPDKIEPLLTEHTSAILPVHVYGHLCDVKKIKEIAKKHNLKVIYDAAHAFGVTTNGVSAGIFGDVSMFSFHATKLFHSIEGGALIYEDENYTHLFNAYKNFGIEGEEKVDYIGGNAKMNEFQAAMGLANIPYIHDIITEREKITLRYRENMADIQGVRFFVPEARGRVEHNYAYFPVLIDPILFGVGRDVVYSKLKEVGIYTRKYFWPITADFGCYREKHKDDDLPVARKAGDQVLCLPIYNGLPLETVNEICMQILKCRK
ncbi:MAG: DegT/DnrJ/EryC1/StrS family aminotransferase [Flexilinea sp.]